jgi:hypothetical protein
VVFMWLESVLLDVRNGGPFMLAVATAGGLALIVNVLVLPVLLALRVRVPAAIWMAGPVLVVALGMIGHAMRVSEAMAATYTAPVSLVQTMGFSGAGLALLPPALGAWSAGFVPVLGAVVAPVGALIATRGTRASIDGRGLLVGTLGTLLVAVASVVWVLLFLRDGGTLPLLGGAVLLVGVLPMGLVAVRVPVPGEALDLEELDEEARQARRQLQDRVRRLARTTRGAVVASMTLGLACLAVAIGWLGLSEAAKAVAVAPPEMRQTMVMGGQGIASMGRGSLGLSAVLFLLGPGVASLALARPSLLRTKALGWSAAGLVPPLLLLLVAGAVRWNHERLLASAEVEMPDLDAARARAGGPLTVEDPLGVEDGDLGDVVVFADGDWVLVPARRAGEPQVASTPLTEEGLPREPLLVVGPDQPVSILREAPWSDPDRDADAALLLEETPGVSVPVTFLRIDRTPPSRAYVQQFQPILWFPDGELRRAMRGSDDLEVVRPGRGTRGRLFVLHEGVTLHDLVRRCEASRFDPCRVSAFPLAAWQGL